MEINSQKVFDGLMEFLRDIEEKMKSPDTNIFDLHFQRNKYISNLLRDNLLTKDVYKKLVEYNLADHNLITVWKTPGYENVCCLRCIQPLDHKFNNVCKCRLPAKYNENMLVCENCECHGCGSF